MEYDIHEHLKGRMEQRGIALQEIQQVLDQGWDAVDAKPGTLGKVLVFPYNREWEGRVYEEKEITVYYKEEGSTRVLLTARARYGRAFLERLI